MNEKKKTTPEEDYFAQENIEKLKELRSQLNEERARQAEESCELECWMRCPKCCGNLEEVKFEDIHIDICKECGGIYLDAGELEIVINSRAGMFNNLVHWYKKGYEKK